MRPDPKASDESWIIVCEDGKEITPLAGVAVGYDDAGALVVEEAGIEHLAKAERGRIAAELERLAAQLRRLDVN